MAITFFISTPLRVYTGGNSQVALAEPAATVAEALEALWRLHPGLKDRILTERREVRAHVNVFVGNESIRYTGGLDTPLPGSCEISLLPAVSGGTA